MDGTVPLGKAGLGLSTVCPRLSAGYVPKTASAHVCSVDTPAGHSRYWYEEIRRELHVVVIQILMNAAHRQNLESAKS